MTVDTPTPYTLAELNDQLDGEMGRLDNQSSLGPLQKLKGRLAAVQSDPRYGFMFPSEIFLVGDLAAILGQLFRVPADGRPICRLDFSEISSEILNVVAVVGRLAFSLAVSIGQKTPLLLICEEAHRYAPQNAALGFEPAKRSLARIAKEAGPARTSASSRRARIIRVDQKAWPRCRPDRHRLRLAQRRGRQHQVDRVQRHRLGRDEQHRAELLRAGQHGTEARLDEARAQHAAADRRDPRRAGRHRRPAQELGQVGGPDDQVGTLNYTTADDIVRAAGLVRKGQVISLALNYDKDGPQGGKTKFPPVGRFNPAHTMLRSGSDAYSGTLDKRGIRSADDMVLFPLQAGTHWDGLGHIFFDNHMWNDDTGSGSHPTSDVFAAGGKRRHHRRRGWHRGPDNVVSAELDHARIRWSAEDMTENRPACRAGIPRDRVDAFVAEAMVS